MKDREIFQKAIKELPSLLLLLLGAMGMVKIVEYGAYFFYDKFLIDSVLLLNFVIECVSCLMSLGCYRLCLTRGLGKRGSMPWSVFRKVGRYKSWIIWMGLVPALWKTGKLFLNLWMLDRMSDEAFHQYSVLKSYLSVLLVIGSYLLFMLLSLSVRTAYLYAPEKGFWSAFFYGLKEGVRKWPKTIGPQVKYVLTVLFAFRMISGYLIVPILRNAGLLNSSLLIQQGLQAADKIWTMVFYGFLAAERYDPPGKVNSEAFRVKNGEIG